MNEIDSEILRILREDGRISWRDLGAAVGLSANAAADRVRRLRHAGVITGFTALVDPGAGGRTLEALVGVTVASDTDSDDFAAAAAQLEPVLEVLHLAARPTISSGWPATTPPSSTSCSARSAAAAARRTPRPRSSCGRVRRSLSDMGAGCASTPRFRN